MMNRSAERRGFVKGGAGVFKCRSCGRGSRSIGNGDNELIRLCVECFDLGGEENHLSDNGSFYGSADEVLANIAAVAAKGGNASIWADLKAKAEAAKVAAALDDFNYVGSRHHY